MSGQVCLFCLFVGSWWFWCYSNLNTSELKVVSPSSHGSSLMFNDRMLLVLFLVSVTSTFENSIQVVCTLATLPIQKAKISLYDCHGLEDQKGEVFLFGFLSFLLFFLSVQTLPTWLFRNSAIVSHGVADYNSSDPVKFRGPLARHGQIRSE